MFTFYSKKELQQTVETSIKRIDDALAIEDTTQRAEALLAAQQEAFESYSDLGSSVVNNTYLSIAGSVALAMTGALITLSALPALVTAGTLAVGFFCITGFASIFKSRIDDSAIDKKINPLLEKIATEISTIFTQDQDSFMKTSVGKVLSEKFQKDLSDKFCVAADKKNKTDLDYTLLKENTANPALKA